MIDAIVSSQLRARADEEGVEQRRWLLLTHHLPPNPAYFRVKVGRRLARVGAVALKNSVYVLPLTAETLEDFQWLFLEIEQGGGEASISEATFLDGVSDARLVAQFRRARESDYDELGASARALLDELRGDSRAAEGVADPGGKLQRLTRRLQEVAGVDFFGAEGRAAAEHAVELVRDALAGESESREDESTASAGVGTGRTWVTRAGVKVDRIASAWLIRRFIDPEARLRFVETTGEQPSAGELRFDMFDGEFTHVRDACTFETLLQRFGLTQPALAALAEIVHDIDCKDGKFGRAEVAGVASLIDGIVRRHENDALRIERGAAVLDELYEHFRAAAA